MGKKTEIDEQYIKNLIKKYADMSYEIYIEMDKVKKSQIELNERDINNIYWFSEEHLEDSHQLSDTVTLAIRILRNHAD